MGCLSPTPQGARCLVTRSAASPASSSTPTSSFSARGSLLERRAWTPVARRTSLAARRAARRITSASVQGPAATTGQAAPPSYIGPSAGEIERRIALAKSIDRLDLTDCGTGRRRAPHRSRTDISPPAPPCPV